METRTTTPRSLTFAVLLCATMAVVPQTALAMDVTKTYAPGADVPQTITEDNTVLTVKGKEYIDLAPTTDTKDVTESRTKTINAGDWNGNASSYFAQEEAATQGDGYTGTLKLNSATSSVSATSSSSRVVTITKTDTALSQEEVDALPTTITEDVEGHGLQTFELQGKDVSPAETGVRRFAVVSTYAATVQDTSPSEYTLTASYSGKVTKQIDNGQEVVVTYSDEKTQPTFYDNSVEQQATPAEQPTEQPAEQQNSGVPILAIIGIVLLGAGALGAGAAFMAGKMRNPTKATTETEPIEEPNDGEPDEEEAEEQRDDDVVKGETVEEEPKDAFEEDEPELLDEQEYGTTVLPHMRE